MNRQGAISKFALIGLIISLALIAGLAYLFQSERAKSINLQAQVEELTVRGKLAEEQLEVSKRKVSDLTLNLQEAKERLASVTEELDKEKSARRETANELAQIKSDIEQQKRSRQDIENKLTQALDEGRKLKEQLASIEKKRVELESKIKSLESASSGVELGKVVVSGETPASAQNANASPDQKQAVSSVKPLEGKVTVVNKEYNFAVINLGQKDGVKIGDQFFVSRAGKSIADIKVEKVHESMSAAGFAPEAKDTIQENDLVVQKVK